MLEPPAASEHGEEIDDVEPEYALPADAKRERLVKASAEPIEGFGKRPEKRTIQELMRWGVINLDKPRGPTSHQTVAWLRDLMGLAKVGHGGTLDPKVTGVLPTCLDEATKAVKALLGAGKEYVCVMRLHTDVPENVIRGTAQRIVGDVEQLPPVRSAVARRVRTRRIYYLHVLEIDGRDVLFRVGCEAGTYIRNLCIDWGQRMNTRAHMQELRRSRSGSFREEDAVPLLTVADAYKTWKRSGDDTRLRDVLQPMERILDHLPKIVVRDSAVDALCHGAPLHVPGVLEVDDGLGPRAVAAVMSLKGEAVALVRASMTSKDIVAKDTGVAAAVDRVLMPKGTYPPMWKRKA